MKTLKVLGLIALLLVIASVALLGYLGFLPGLSSVFGADKPRDLGVQYTERDVQSARSKVGSQNQDLPPGAAPKDSFKLSGQRQVNASFTQEELTALVNTRGKAWKYYPVSDSQVRVNSDGTLEYSGKVLVAHLDGFAQVLNMSAEERQSVKDYMSAFKIDPPIYVKASGSVINNKVTNLDIKDVNVGRLSVPSALLGDTNRVASFLEGQRSVAQGLSVRSLNVEGGRVKFDGTVPAVVQTSKEQRGLAPAR